MGLSKDSQLPNNRYNNQQIKILRTVSFKCKLDLCSISKLCKFMTSHSGFTFPNLLKYLPGAPEAAAAYNRDDT